ncbi:sulfate transporter CysZ [Echinimonas agarilytica]|uniref:Sulfate transporter CysZ n=1 Tax=Echinimonas agarilytica TaxID=1215918 RepID=A0AA42B6Z9_9GAMM|nr:sulfate transporter CysZ [Echinimonas agarilytica]MCM2679314.1 sulfate transporter CysZ [Echinimonas agarilytica]
MQVTDRKSSGAAYFFKGFDLITVPGIRPFVIVPLAINFIIFAVSFTLLLQQLGDWMTQLENYLPSWLNWAHYVLWPLAILSVIVVFSFLFATVANWLAAPFNGLLSEKVELYMTGKPINDDGFLDLIKDIPRLFAREFQKLGYYLPRAIGCLILFFIPLIGQTLAPVLWFLFSAWMMAIQYCDYPFDNHKISFKDMKATLKAQRGQSMSFGVMVMLFTMVPILNLLVMPVAICGATAMWVQTQRDDVLAHKK